MCILNLISVLEIASRYFNWFEMEFPSAECKVSLTGLCLRENYLASYFSSFIFIFQRSHRCYIKWGRTAAFWEDDFVVYKIYACVISKEG
jgi:hypothetical protein